MDKVLVWCRRELRAHDHAALYHALKQSRQVVMAFVFDTDILGTLPQEDRRVEFIRDSAAELDAELRALSAHRAGLVTIHGSAVDEIPRLAQALGVQAVMTHHDDEPSALARDAQVRGRLADVGIAMHTTKDHVIFERDEILTAGGTPFSVFTPYKKAWLKKVSSNAFYLRSYPSMDLGARLATLPECWRTGVPTLDALGFAPTNLRTLKIFPGTSGAREAWADFLTRMDRYDQARDFPAIKGPSYLSMHLRFGTLSIREVARVAWERAQAGSRGAQVWLSELIWRDFYMQILHHHPRVVNHAFRPEYDRIAWEHGKPAKRLFQAWCEGQTGYPLVDAAMAQINQTGYMHNRLRMVVASFLVKDLGLDWRWGEQYFAQHLNDFDLAANNGGWQWAASTGCDAQPYFRIFNPVTQSEKFDPGAKFIGRYVPPLNRLPEKLRHAPWKASAADLGAVNFVLGRDYPGPIVDHDEARRATLARFSALKAK